MDGEAPQDLDQELADAMAELMLALVPPESDAARNLRETAEMIESCQNPELVWRMLDGPIEERRGTLDRNPWIRQTFGRRIGAPPIVRARQPAPARAPRRVRSRCRARRAARRGATRAGPGGDDPPDPEPEPPSTGAQHAGGEVS